jgi:two-component system response regulator MprA
MRVLIVEDDAQVRAALSRALNFEGYEIETASDGAEGLEKVLTSAPDAIVLDVMMPHVDGLEATRRLRARGNTTPILMLTARHEVSDRVAGLDAGADDYLVKPFALEELLARLRALLRRSEPDTTEVMSVADLTLDPSTRRVQRGDTPVELTKTEFQLLELLMFNEGSSCSTKGSCSPERRSTNASGDSTSEPPPTLSTSTSATCAARPNRMERRG